MAKSLKTILETYAPRSADEKRFIDKHVVVKHADRNGNGDEIFKASNIKAVKRATEHGYDAGKDTAVYESTEARRYDKHWDMQSTHVKNNLNTHLRNGSTYPEAVAKERKQGRGTPLNEEQLDEIFGRFGPRLGPKQSQLYPHNHFTKYGEDHNRGPMGLPDMGHGFNFERHKPDIENHPHFTHAVDVCDDENEYHSLHQQMEHPSVQSIARDTGHSTFQVHDYCNRGPFYRRHGSLDYSKHSPTDVHENVEQVDEIFGRFGPRLGKRQSQLYPHSAEVLHRYAENNGPAIVGKLRSMGHNFNFERHMPDIEHHPHFSHAVDVCDDENEHHSLHDQMNHPSVQSIVHATGHTTFQVHDYCNRGPFYRRHGSLDFDKYSPTDGPGSPYFDRHHDHVPHEHD